MENATGVCEKNGHPIITNSMRVEPFPFKEYRRLCRDPDSKDVHAWLVHKWMVSERPRGDKVATALFL